MAEENTHQYCARSEVSDHDDIDESHGNLDSNLEETEERRYGNNQLVTEGGVGRISVEQELWHHYLPELSA